MSSGAAPCTGYIFSPQGDPWLTVCAKVANTSALQSLRWSALDATGRALAPSSTSDCDDGDPLTACATFQQTGCQPMINYDDATCSFSEADIAFQVTATSDEGAAAATISPAAYGLPNKFTTCSEPMTVKDVSANYQVYFSASREDDLGGTQDISLYRPVITTLKLTKANPFGPHSFFLANLTVQLRIAASSTLLASRVFTREDKLRYMQSSSSPYFADAHYCRAVIPGESSTCTSFYSIHSNQLTSAPALAATYGQGTHKSCEPARSATTVDEDRFIFTPSNWGIDRYAPSGATPSSGASGLELRFIVTAVMTSCDTGMSALDSPGVVQVVHFEMTKPVSTDACQQRSAKACAKAAKAGACVWAPNPALGPAERHATCVAKSTIARWSCTNILATACAANPACKLRKGKCIFRTPSPTRRPSTHKPTRMPTSPTQRPTRKPTGMRRKRASAC